MPILKVRISGQKTQEVVDRISDHLIGLTGRVLGKKPELISIAIEFVEPDAWIVGGEPLSVSGKNSFYFDIKITDETNTKDEKALYLKEAYEGFCDILGNVHEESYIHIEDVRAGAYGYGGKTQEYRYHI